MKLGGRMGHRPRKNPLKFGEDRDEGTDPGFFFFSTFFNIVRAFSPVVIIFS